MDQQNLALDLRVPKWDEVAELLKSHPRAWDGYYTLRSLKELYESRKLFGYVLSIDKSRILILFEIVQYPLTKVLRVAFLVGTGLNKFKHLVPALDFLASSLNCDKIEVTGRAGFRRFLPEEYREITRTWTKEIDNGSSK